MKLVGLIALSDPPRKDSAALVSELKGLGVRTVMVTGDAPATAAIVAKAVGLDGLICPLGPIPDDVHPEQFAVFAGVLPEDKYKLVKAFQKEVTPSACAATELMMRLHCAKPRWESPFPRQPTLSNRRPAWC